MDTYDSHLWPKTIALTWVPIIDTAEGMGRHDNDACVSAFFIRTIASKQTAEIDFYSFLSN